MGELPRGTPLLTDGDISLGGWRDSDAAALAAICRDDTIVRWTDEIFGACDLRLAAENARA